MTRPNDYAPGEAWIRETLTHAKDLRGWQARRIERDPDIRGVLHVTLVDRYGREYRYRVFVIPEETAIRFIT